MIDLGMLSATKKQGTKVSTQKTESSKATTKSNDSVLPSVATKPKGHQSNVDNASVPRTSDKTNIRKVNSPKANNERNAPKDNDDNVTERSASRLRSHTKTVRIREADVDTIQSSDSGVKNATKVKKSSQDQKKIRVKSNASDEKTSPKSIGDNTRVKVDRGRERNPRDEKPKEEKERVSRLGEQNEKRGRSRGRAERQSSIGTQGTSTTNVESYSRAERKSSITSLNTTATKKLESHRRTEKKLTSESQHTTTSKSRSRVDRKSSIDSQNTTATNSDVRTRRRGFSRTRDSQQPAIVDAKATESQGKQRSRSMSVSSSSRASGAYRNKETSTSDDLQNFMQNSKPKTKISRSSKSVISSGTQIKSRGRELRRTNSEAKIINCNPQEHEPEGNKDVSPESVGEKDGSNDSETASDIESESESEDEHMKRLKERREMLRQRPNAVARSRSSSRTRGIARTCSGRHPEEMVQCRLSNNDLDLSMKSDHVTSDKRSLLTKTGSLKSCLVKGSSSRSLSKDGESAPRQILKKTASTRSLTNKALKTRRSDSVENSEADEIDSDGEAENQTNKFLSFLSFTHPGTTKKISEIIPTIQSSVSSTGIVRLMSAIGYKRPTKESDENSVSEEQHLIEQDDEGIFKVQRKSSQRGRFESNIKKHHGASRTPIKEQKKPSDQSYGKYQSDGDASDDKDISRSKEMPLSVQKETRWEKDESQQCSPKRPRRKPSNENLQAFLDLEEQVVKRSTSSRRATASVAGPVRTKAVNRNPEKQKLSSTLSSDSQASSIRRVKSIQHGTMPDITRTDLNNFTDLSAQKRSSVTRKPSMSRSVA